MGTKKHEFPFPPRAALKKFVQKFLGHLSSTSKSRWVLEKIVKNLKKEGRNAEAAEISKIIKKIIKHERTLVEKKEQLLAEYYELKLKELEELLKQIELSENKTKKFIEELAKSFQEFNDPALKAKLDHLAELYYRFNQLLAEITEYKKEIEQCQDKIKQNEALIEVNTQTYNKKVCIIDNKIENLISNFGFVPKIEGNLKAFLEESDITIPSLPGNLINKLFIDYSDKDLDFKMGGDEWNANFVEFCMANIMLLLRSEQKETFLKKELDNFLQSQLLLHREQVSEIGEELRPLQKEKKMLREMLKQNNDIPIQEKQSMIKRIEELEVKIEPLQKELEETQQEIQEIVRVEELTEYANLEVPASAIQITYADLDFTDEVKKISQIQEIGNDNKSWTKPCALS
jgi:DNA repair exonuclease SbcCD ATPase subunit